MTDQSAVRCDRDIANAEIRAELDREKLADNQGPATPVPGDAADQYRERWSRCQRTLLSPMVQVGEG
jgi:hypothetical protein